MTESWKEDCKCYRRLSESDWKRIDETASCAISIHSSFLTIRGAGETVRVFGRPEELAERLEASGYDIPASEIEAGMELHLPCLVKVGQGKNGYKNIEEFLPDAAE